MKTRARICADLSEFLEPRNSVTGSHSDGVAWPERAHCWTVRKKEADNFPHKFFVCRIISDTFTLGDGRRIRVCNFDSQRVSRPLRAHSLHGDTASQRAHSNYHPKENLKKLIRFDNRKRRTNSKALVNRTRDRSEENDCSQPEACHRSRARNMRVGAPGGLPRHCDLPAAD